MKYHELREWSARVAQWADQYYQTLSKRPVCPPTRPGELVAALPPAPPESPEPMERIFADFVSLIPDRMTHWQHPRFFAYFPSNAAAASILAEQVVNAFSAQCMLWQTSPAATELEIAMVDWMRQALGLPDVFRGLIQDTATTATLCAVLTMRERALNWQGNESGLSTMPRLRIYASAQTHSSIDKAVRLAGIGQENLVKVATHKTYSMDAEQLQTAINRDRAAGFVPAGLIGCIGGTSIGASDRLSEILAVAERENMYSHVDAAWAGSAMICPELRWLWDGVEKADSIVVNPHKWLGANFDCSIQFLRRPEEQMRTVAVKPHYLQSLEKVELTNFSEWTIPLGRRFRALKLWFLFRAYGLAGLRQRIRNHVAWAARAADAIAQLPFMEIVTPPQLALFTFRFAPPGFDPDDATKSLLERINADGRIYLTQTTHDGAFVIRMSIGQFESTWDDVQCAIATIRELAQEFLSADRGADANGSSQ